MRTQVRKLAGLAHDDDVDLPPGLPVDSVVGLLLALDPGNRHLAAELPSGIDIADVRYVFVATFTVRFRNAIDFEFLHLTFLHRIAQPSRPVTPLSKELRARGILILDG